MTSLLLALVCGTWNCADPPFPEPCDGSYVMHEVALSAIPAVIDIGTMERDAFGVVFDWSACDVTCADTPCLVPIPDPGQADVVFRVNVGEILSVGPKEPA